MILGRVRLCKKKERMVWQESKSNLRQSVLCNKPWRGREGGSLIKYFFNYPADGWSGKGSFVCAGMRNLDFF